MTTIEKLRLEYFSGAQNAPKSFSQSLISSICSSEDPISFADECASFLTEDLALRAPIAQKSCKVIAAQLLDRLPPDYFTDSLYAFYEHATAPSSDCEDIGSCTYFTSAGPVTLRQRATAISDIGSTLWDAGAALASVMLASPALVEGRRVLELGAGTGLTAVCACRAGAACVLATDGCPRAVANLEHNLQFNGCKGAQGMELNWCDAEMQVTLEKAENKMGGKPDLVFAADVAYCPSLSKMWAGAAKECAKRWPDAELVLAHTHRAEETSEALFGALADNGFEILRKVKPEVLVPELEVPFPVMFPEAVEIMFLKLKQA